MSLAANPFFATPERRTALARERFFEDGERPLGLVSEALLQSWQRCLQAGHRPERAPALEPVTRSRLRAAVERNHALLEAAAPEIDRLDASLAGTGCKALLTDRDGVVVRVTPGPAARRGVLEAAGRVGVDLGEPSLASTAPGISAVAGTAVVVAGAEHFFGALREVHCAAAPIRDAHGRIAGVLDLSVEGRGFAFDALAIARLAAAAIENRLLERQARGRVLLRFHADARLLGTPFEGLAAVDGAGRVAWVNAAGRMFAAAAGDELEARFGLRLGALLDLARSGGVRAHRLPGGLQVMLRACVDDAALPPRDEQPAPAPRCSLRATSRQAIEAALARCGGNLSAAARELGVSRGLLYRRLRERAEPAG